MNSDATTLQNALAVLRRNYGEQLAGPEHSTQAQMRDTLQQQLGLDEMRADSLVKELSDTGRLVYMGNSDAGTEPGTTETGPVISMPTTQTADGGQPLITTASPAMVMGITNDGGGDVGSSVDQGSDDIVTDMAHSSLMDIGPDVSSAAVTVGEREEVEDDRTDGYWRIG